MSLKTPHFGERGSVRHDCEVENLQALSTSLWESCTEENALSRDWSIGLGGGGKEWPRSWRRKFAQCLQKEKKNLQRRETKSAYGRCTSRLGSWTGVGTSTGVEC